MRPVPLERSGAALLGCILLASASGAAAQTCRTSLSTGMTLCDNGATARTSPVTGATTFTDGRTARTSPVTGTARFDDGSLVGTAPAVDLSASLPVAIVPGKPVTETAIVADRIPAETGPKQSDRKPRPGTRE